MPISLPHKRLIHLIENRGKKTSLEVVQEIEKSLGHPSRAFASIHIAGTNGKGSVACKIAAMLKEKKENVGLYTSPHLIHVNERISVQGQDISPMDLDRCLSQVFLAMDRLQVELNFFEVLTLSAFLYFAEKNISWAVIEVGKGGRLDATNLLIPRLTIITSIGLDHTQDLGKTREEIAVEKAGIIKSSVPLILGPQAADLDIIQKIAEEKRSPCHVVRGDFSDYEKENRAIAAASFQQLSLGEPSNEALQAVPLCRFQIFQKDIPIILDVGHNPPALEALFKRIKTAFPLRPICTLFALSADKEIEKCAQIVSTESVLVVCTQASFRSLSANELSAFCDPVKIKHVQEDSEQAFCKAYEETCSLNGVLVACGTFYLMASVLSQVSREKELLLC